MEVSDYLANLKTAIDNIGGQESLIVNQNKEQILDYNRQDQLYKQGIDSKGKKLKPYAFFTIQIKQLIGQPFDRTTLFYSGRFYNRFNFVFLKRTINIFSSDSKTTDLEKKYGKDIFGLTKDNKIKMETEVIKPKLDQWLKKYL